MSYKKHIFNSDTFDVSSTKLNINLMKYYIENELIYIYKEKKVSRKLHSNNINNWRKPTKFVIPDNKLITTLYKFKSYNEERQFSYIELLNDINNNFDSDKPNIKIDVKLKDEIKQITINSINLQLIKIICNNLNNGDNEDEDNGDKYINNENYNNLIDILLNDLNTKRIVINEDYNDNIKIIGIPNIYNTLPFLINSLFTNNTNIDFKLCNKYLENNYEKSFNYIDELITLYNKGDTEYSKLELLKSKILKYKSDKNTSFEKIYNLPNFKFEYNFYVLENNDGIWKPKYYHIRELKLEDKPILLKIQKIIEKLYNKVYNTNTIINYNNYISYVSYIDIFNISTLFLHPFDNDKVYFYKIKSKIMLEELINELQYINNVKINLDINNNYFKDNYKIINKIILTNNLVDKKNIGDVYFNKDLNIIYFNGSKWNEYEMLYIESNNKLKYINFIANVNDKMCYFDVLKYIENDDKVLNILKNIKKYNPIYNYKLTDSQTINNDIIKNYYPLQTSKLINVYNLNKEKYNTNSNTNSNSNNNTNLFKSLEIYTNTNNAYKVIKTKNLYLFIQKNYTGDNKEKLLVWILNRKLIENNTNNVNKLIKISVDNNSNNNDNNKFRDIYDLKLENLLELKEALNSINITSDKYFIYFNKYNPIYTKQLHLHILKKENYYYYPKHGLNMNISDFQKILYLDNFINYLSLNPKYINNIKNNSILLYDNIELELSNIKKTYSSIVKIGLSKTIKGGSITTKHNSKNKKTKKGLHKVKTKITNNNKKTKKRSKKEYI